MTAAEGRDRDASLAPGTTRAEIDALTAQLRALTNAVDRLTERIDSVVVASSCAEYAPVEADVRGDDPFAWPTDEDVARYCAGRVLGDRF